MNNFVDILSVFNGKLLVGSTLFPLLFIYSHDCRHLSNITIIDSDNKASMLRKAMWTPRGNILYTTWKLLPNYHRTCSVVAASESGKVIATQTHMTCEALLSVSNENVIYLADDFGTVYQSTDDGISWSVVFKSTDGLKLLQVIKATTDHSDDFWILGWSEKYKHHLLVYTMDRSHLNGKVTWRHVNVSTTDDKHIDLLSSCSILLYDGKTIIFVSNCKKTVHVLSLNGQCHSQLQSLHNFENRPYSMAIDKERQLLYVGQKGFVKILKLKYGNEG